MFLVLRIWPIPMLVQSFSSSLAPKYKTILVARENYQLTTGFGNCRVWGNAEGIWPCLNRFRSLLEFMLKHVTCRFFVRFCRFWNRCFYPFYKHPFGSQGFDQSGSDSMIMRFGTPQTRNNWCLVLCPGKTHRNRCHFLQQQHRSIWQSGSLAVCVTAARGGLWRCWCTEERAMAPPALRPQKLELVI